MTGPRSRLGQGQEPFRVPSKRAMGWSHVGSLACPDGHAIKADAFAFTDGAIRCKHRHPGGECGKMLYLVAAIPARLPQTMPEYVFHVEVSYPEIRYIQEKHMGPLAALHWLGATRQADPPVPGKDTAA